MMPSRSTRSPLTVTFGSEKPTRSLREGTKQAARRTSSIAGRTSSRAMVEGSGHAEVNLLRLGLSRGNWDDRPEASSSSLTVEGEPFLPGLLGQTGESRIDLGFLRFPRLFQGDTLLHHLLGLSAPLAGREAIRERGIIPDAGIIRAGLEQVLEGLVSLLVSTFAEETLPSLEGRVYQSAYLGARGRISGRLGRGAIRCGAGEPSTFRDAAERAPKALDSLRSSSSFASSSLILRSS